MSVRPSVCLSVCQKPVLYRDNTCQTCHRYMFYTVCRCLSGYRLRFLHSSVFEPPIPHVSSTSAYRRRISLAEPVHVVRNVEIWPCRKQQRNSANEFQRCRSSHLEQSSETLALVLHLQRTVSAWIENPALRAGIQPQRTLCGRVCPTELTKLNISF